MSYEIDWYVKCRRVAEWLGEMWHADDVYPPHRTRYKFSEALIRWPDYTRDDAAAMRLQRRLPAMLWREVSNLGRWRHELEVRRNAVEWVVRYTFRWRNGVSHRIAEYDSDLRKALLLAACELIDMGAEPRGKDG